MHCTSSLGRVPPRCLVAQNQRLELCHLFLHFLRICWKFKFFNSALARWYIHDLADMNFSCLEMSMGGVITSTYWLCKHLSKEGQIKIKWVDARLVSSSSLSAFFLSLLPFLLLVVWRQHLMLARLQYEHFPCGIRLRYSTGSCSRGPHVL
jgi:hypothetical protein